MHAPSALALDPARVAAARARVAVSLLRLSDGDPSFTDAVRGWLWADYCAAGAPFGHSEDGLYVWCDPEEGGSALAVELELA